MAWCWLVNYYIVCDAFNANRYKNPLWGQVMVTTWSKEHGHFMFYQRLLKLGNYHFCIMSERTLFNRTDNVWAKCYKSQKWEREARSAEMHVCVGWYVTWNSLWCYTTLPSYNFIEWMISMIATVCLWRHSKYRTSQTGPMYVSMI